MKNFWKKDPSLGDYMANATGGKKYDFKAANGTDQVVYDPKDYYRGMPMDKKRRNFTAVALIFNKKLIIK